MSRGLADTSVFIASESGRSLTVEKLPDQLSVSIVTVAELRAGVLAAVDVASRDRRLTTLERALRLDPVPVDDEVAHEWTRLRIDLRNAGRKMNVNDAWIAATARALDVPLVTQDGDYEQVPGLTVIAV